MTAENLLQFISQYCKKKDHRRCCGLWEGLGFKVLCNCVCHRINSIQEKEEVPI